jgi:hypothetical protein
MDAHIGGFEAQIWSPEGSVEQWSQIGITLMKSRIRIRIKVKSRIRIRIKVRWIRNPGRNYPPVFPVVSMPPPSASVRIKVKCRIRIRIKVMRNCNPCRNYPPVFPVVSMPAPSASVRIKVKFRIRDATLAGTTHLYFRWCQCPHPAHLSALK